MSNEYRDDEKIVDNRGWLPGWWTWMLVGGIVFALVYALLYRPIWETTHMQEEYDHEVKTIAAKQAAAAPKLGEIGPEGTNPLRGDAAAVAAGKGVYDGKCMACHGADAVGSIGPSLVDTAWLWGDKDKDVYDVIKNGRMEPKQQPSKGPMPVLADVTITEAYQVMAWIASKNPSLLEK